MELKVSAKNLQSNVRYINPVKEIQLGEYETFFLSEIQKEVMTLNKSTLKKYRKICIQTISILASALTLSSQVAFTTVTAVSGSPFIPMPDTKQIGIDPQQIMLWGGIILIGMMAIGGIIAAICWSITGIQRILFGKKKRAQATEWKKEIVKGYADVLMAPVVIGLITLAAILLFGHFSWYVKPFQG